MKTPALLTLLILLISGCQSTEVKNSTEVRDDSLYLALGGQAGLEQIVDLVIEEIHYDPVVFPHFQDTNWDRFREKQLEHLCLITGGGCTYTGDSMEDVHAGMNISEAGFNAIVDDLQTAMEKLDIPIGAQNQLLAILARMHKEIVYH